MNIKEIFAKNELVIQTEAYTCGPCSLLNVLALRGDVSHTEQELAERCGAAPGVGTSHESLVRVAQEVGLKVIDEKTGASASDIRHSIDAGACVVVNFLDQYSGKGHYAVITEYDDAAFYLRDCTSGFLRLQTEYFVKNWRSGDGIPQWYVALT